MSTITEPLNPIEVHRLEEAADWLLRLKESPSDEALVEWLDWCERDPQNLGAFEGLQTVWNLSDAQVHRAKGGLNLKAPPVRMRRARLALPLAWAAALLATFGVLLMLRTHFGIARSDQTLSTPLAMHSTSLLEDGSRLALGGLSKVSTRFSEQQRIVIVESGEAFFDVAKDPARPFVVQAGPIAITAIGTAFNVRRGPDRVIVSVAEGRVGVAAEKHQAVQVDANQQISYALREHRLSVAPVNPALATSWQHGVFKYVSEPLADVVSDLNRYTPRKIRIESPELMRERFTGTVFGSRIDDWLEALQSAFPIDVDRSPDAIVIRPRER